MKKKKNFKFSHKFSGLYLDVRGGGRVVGIHTLQRSQLKNKSKVSIFWYLLAVLRVLKFALMLHMDSS